MDVLHSSAGKCSKEAAFYVGVGLGPRRSDLGEPFGWLPLGLLRDGFEVIWLESGAIRRSCASLPRDRMARPRCGRCYPGLLVGS
jgi:hypothetical protein